MGIRKIGCLLAVCLMVFMSRACTVNLFLHPTWEKEHIQRVIDAFVEIHNAHLK